MSGVGRELCKCSLSSRVFRNAQVPDLEALSAVATHVESDARLTLMWDSTLDLIPVICGGIFLIFESAVAFAPDWAIPANPLVFVGEDVLVSFVVRSMVFWEFGFWEGMFGSEARYVLCWRWPLVPADCLFLDGSFGGLWLFECSGTVAVGWIGCRSHCR